LTKKWLSRKLANAFLATAADVKTVSVTHFTSMKAVSMTHFTSFSELSAACLDLPSGHPAASAAVAQRETTLTKPPKSLGRLEDLVAWLAYWQGHAPPCLDQVEILVFAGNHGVTRHGVSAYPAEVTAQMVANFAAGDAAINQLARKCGRETTRHSA
jgi:nicotinate-nucleotide--dimethylbenzimidazole phosphoribosyltransferase